MSLHSPHQSQSRFQFNPSTPPPPPPKPSGHSSGRATPLTGPPLPPPPDHNAGNRPSGTYQPNYEGEMPDSNSIPIQPPEDGWLPDIVKDKTTADLQHILSDLSLQQSLIHSPTTAHPSLPASTAPLQSLLSDNLALAHSLKALESRIQAQRQATQSRLLSLRAMEGQWRAKQAEQDAALRDFSPPSLYQRLSASVGEQDALCRTLENSFLEGEDDEGQASERDVADFVRRLREARKVAYLRRERKERWDEGRVGGWR